MAPAIMTSPPATHARKDHPPSGRGVRVTSRSFGMTRYSQYRLGERHGPFSPGAVLGLGRSLDGPLAIDYITARFPTLSLTPRAGARIIRALPAALVAVADDTEIRLERSPGCRPARVREHGLLASRLAPGSIRQPRPDRARADCHRRRLAGRVRVGGRARTPRRRPPGYRAGGTLVAPAGHPGPERRRSLFQGFLRPVLRPRWTGS